MAKKGAERIIEEATGLDIPDAGDAIREIEEIIEGSSEPPEEAVQRALDEGRIRQRSVDLAEGAIMVDFNDFMAIGLNQCGSDQRTFRQLTKVWNREKDEIRSMTQREVRENLRCP